MKKTFVLAVAALMGFAFGAKAQTNVQVYYDLGKDRNYVTTTFEMFKADQYGDTFFFIDHYYTSKIDRDLGMSSAINGSYFEIERGLNFWQDSKMKDLSAHIEYDGSTWGAGILALGAKYFLHSADYSNTLTLYLMYDQHLGVGSADVPVKFSGVWGMQDLFGAKGLRFNGFIDVWGNNGPFGKTSVLTEPQLWYSLDGEHINIGTEIELSYNFAGHDGFMCNPCIGLKWVF